jgi:hypothetical protein
MIVSKAKRGPKPSTILIYVFCIIMAVFFLAPIVAAVANSLKTPSEASAVPPTYFPSKLSFENYQVLSQYGQGVWQYVSNSAAAASITVFGALVLRWLRLCQIFVSWQKHSFYHHSLDPHDSFSIHSDTTFFNSYCPEVAKHYPRFGVGVHRVSTSLWTFFNAEQF